VKRQKYIYNKKGPICLEFPLIFVLNVNWKEASYLISIWSKKQEVKWYGGHEVDDKPASEVVNSYFWRLTHNLIIFTDISGPKIDQDVNDEHDVN